MDEQGGAGLSPRMILLVADARTQWAELDRRIAAFDAEFVQWAKENEEARRLTTIPGFGAIVASALVAAVGHAESFDRGRDHGGLARSGSAAVHHRRQAEAVWGSASAGNKYLRKQLIHGARAALPYVAERDTPLGRWAKALMAAPIAMSRSSPSPTSWRGSPGRSCDAESHLPPRDDRRRLRGQAVGRKASIAYGCLREGDDEMASHGEALVNLGVRTGTRVGFRDPRSMWPEPMRHEPARLRARSTSHSVAARTAAP